MCFFKKLFKVKKNPAGGYMNVLHALEERHQRELVQQKLIADEMFQRELKSAYSRGYGEAQADIFAAIKKDPDQYHEFIEKHRTSEIPLLTWENVEKDVKIINETRAGEVFYIDGPWRIQTLSEPKL
jgi:16S rRNA C967 or C1407 C5-methylase (RsmB/RsmF family)